MVETETKNFIGNLSKNGLYFGTLDHMVYTVLFLQQHP